MSNEQLTKKRKLTSEFFKDDNPPVPSRGLLIKKHSEKGRAPTRGSALAAGYDLYRLGIGLSNHDTGSKLIRLSARKGKLFQLGGEL